LKTNRNPQSVHPPLAAYSHQIELSGPERLLILSGQVGMRADGTIPPDPIDQLDVALLNLQANLAAADMKVEDVVKVTLFLVGEVNRERRREVVSSHFGSHKPCMTLIYAAALAAPEYRVEVDAWASQAV
jgi:enamine deaminase RidA (YjgF/YER057c/UK114 family)